MKSEDALERQLRGWTLRRPSARLKRGLFGEAGYEVGVGGRTGTAGAWWVSATGTAVACFLMWWGPAEVPNGVWVKAGAGSFYGMSNGLGEGLVMPDSLSHANCWQGQRFEWTRTGGITSSSAPAMVLATNRLGR